MSGGNLSPRQKMINMMYLMLTAMLALNVSKEVLNAFVIVNESITKTNELFYDKNKSVYALFEKQYLINPGKVGTWKEKADKLHTMADDLYKFIESLKIRIVETSDGKKAEAIKDGVLHAELINSKDNTDAPAQIMIGDGGKGAARELKSKIEELRKVSLSFIDKKDVAVIHSIEDGLNTSPPKAKEGVTESWESAHFEHWPLMGVITILSGLQNNIRNAEAEMINYLYNQITEGELSFNKLEATVIPNSNYVIRGSEYKAAIFLAARDTTQDPIVLVGQGAFPYDSVKNEKGEWEYRMKGRKGVDYDSLSITEGKGIYRVQASRSGNYTWGGLIKIKTPDGGFISRPFRETYQVSDAGAVVSPTKMNVFYLGLDNPVDISVPGFPPDKVSATVSSGSIFKSKDGGWMVKPVQTPSGKMNLNVFVEVDKQKKNMGTKEFRIKPVPDPIPMVAGSRGGDIAKSVLAAQQVVVAELPDFLFDLKFEVVSFNMYTNKGGFLVEQSSSSNKLTNEQKEILRGATVGQRIVFEKIRVAKPGGQISDIGSISFRVK